MTLTAELQSIAHVDPEPIAERIRVRAIERKVELAEEARALRRQLVRETVTTGLAASAACVAVLAGGGHLRRGSAWSGLQAVTSGLGLTGRRPPRAFSLPLVATSLAAIVGGSVIVAGLSLVARRAGAGPAQRAGVVAIGGYLLDRLLMRRELFPALRHAVGGGGVVAKYGAIGLAALASSR